MLSRDARTNSVTRIPVRRAQLPRLVAWACTNMPPLKRKSSDCIFPPPLSECDAKVQRLAADLGSVRAEIRNMRRRVQSSQKPWSPSAAVKLQASLVYELSQDTKWAIVYVRMQQQQNMFRTVRMPENTTDAMIMDWWSALRKNPAFVHARANLGDSHRLKVDNFLIESVLYEYVVKESERQLVVPSSTMIAKYITAWESRPRHSTTTTRMVRMRSRPAMRRTWCNRFRRRWNVTWGVSPPGKTTSMQDMKCQVMTPVACTESSW